ncbi:hypothetical protein CRE_12308 [Caenorhabditis remanei]|uniref:SCP domain-containing protein n=1 Tax=Caenorhabditis remanei TaxID=31234 RepID=E3NEQ0_CAERE|nr:hypothetical protein CRE_12308 [Caenorhabditis remanei]
MKNHFGIGILLSLLICVHGAYVNAETGRKFDPQQLLSEINEKRREWAEKFQIPNMNELNYNMELEEKAKEMRTCDNLTSGIDYMYTVISIGQGLTIPQVESVEEQLNMTIDTFPGLIIPEQSKIGCAEIECRGRDNTRDSILCLTGPKLEFRYEDLKTGPPGSECPNGKGKNGLCFSEEKSISNGFGPKEDLENREPKGGEEKNSSSYGISGLVFCFIFMISGLIGE